jgi:hypothetical protein
MEKFVVLPPLGSSAERALLKQLPNANKIGGVTKLMSTHLKEGVKGMHSVKEMMEAARDCERSLTPKQCAILDAALDAIKEVIFSLSPSLPSSEFFHLFSSVSTRAVRA